MATGIDKAALLFNQRPLISEDGICFLAVGTGQGKRHRRGIDTRAIAFRPKSGPFGFL